MTAHFQFFMILGAAILLLIIFALLKKGQMSVKYSLLWLALAVVLVIFAVFPYVVYVLRDLLDVQMPVNLVFMLMFCFVLLGLYFFLKMGVYSLVGFVSESTTETNEFLFNMRNHNKILGILLLPLYGFMDAMYRSFRFLLKSPEQRSINHSRQLSSTS